MTDSTHRRTILRAVGTAAISAALAGCSGGNGKGGAATSGDSNGGDSNDGQQYLDSEPAYDGWFDGVDNYDGTVDLTGADGVSVSVGAGDTGLLFDPPAIAVSPGTTVTWEWTGSGGRHNVTATDGSFESTTTGDDGFTYDHSFEATGVFEYVCVPHEALGMKGAVVVRSED
ncbi:MAG: halocyanin domain-containing protein [Haloarculaceae archaeon]